MYMGLVLMGLIFVVCGMAFSGYAVFWDYDNKAAVRWGWLLGVTGFLLLLLSFLVP